jgi:hypothetical protein
MHPPTFRLQHRLLDWPECFLEVSCCKGRTLYPIKLLADRRGNPTFEEVLARLRCSTCGCNPRGPVYLCAGHAREFNSGGPPDWSIQILPRPEREA